MTADRKLRGRGAAVLLALPVLCCVGHAVLIPLGLGSMTALVGGVAGSAALVTVGLLLGTAAALIAACRTRARR